MSSSRLFLLGSSLFRPQQTIFPLHTLPVCPATFRFRRICSAALDTVDSVDTVDVKSSVSPTLHPWPEWVAFVDRLKTKGYFIKDSSKKEDFPESVYKDTKLVKEACLSFARDRYDVFSSLSLEDVQRVVERGCPALFRKAVNSSKRLRAHVRLDEGDVCGACDLRGSCDKAYVILQDTEAAARTVDIVRVLLLHALDPVVIYGGENPPGRELVDASARKLLTELVELSENSPVPPMPKPAVKASFSKKERPLSLMDGEPPQDFKMKNGDWVCSKCKFVNFARNEKCRECNEVPDRGSTTVIEMKKGDWMCPNCNFNNFARNGKCLKCRTCGPIRPSTNDVEMKKGDWNCLGCGFMNFSSNRKCLRCQDARPKKQLNPGEWECPSCDFVNFRKNVVCKKCDCKRPREAKPEEEDHVWRRPS